VSSFSIAFETAVAIILVYVPGVNTVLMTRPVPPAHCIVPAFSFFVLMYFYDELRKIYLRSGIVKDKVTGRITYTGWVARNTYY
jgi:sodium/potassium-transporting ATPase subunit alpha